MNEERDSGQLNPDEVIERNIEKSREVIEARKHDANEGEVDRPPKGDPRHTHGNVAPNQWNRPIGGQSNMNVQGGSTRKQKPN